MSRSALVAPVVIGLAIVISGCTSTGDPARPSSPATCASQSAVQASPSDLAAAHDWSVEERAALAALSDDPRPKAAGYDSEGRRMVVIVWTLGDPLSPEDICAYAQLVREATGVQTVVIEPREGPPPSLD